MLSHLLDESRSRFQAPLQLQMQNTNEKEALWGKGLCQQALIRVQTREMSFNLHLKWILSCYSFYLRIKQLGKCLQLQLRVVPCSYHLFFMVQNVKLNGKNWLNCMLSWLFLFCFLEHKLLSSSRDHRWQSSHMTSPFSLRGSWWWKPH